MVVLKGTGEALGTPLDVSGVFCSNPACLSFPDPGPPPAQPEVVPPVPAGPPVLPSARVPDN